MRALKALLPERVEGGGLVLRRWRVEDAELQHRAVQESLDHLRPWMAWAAHEPLSGAERRALLGGWERDWRAGGDVAFAVLRDGAVVGSSGLHRRRGPDVLEIGYWVHAAHVRQGIATAVARLLTAAAFGIPGVSRVEIHHDEANAASGAVPRRLGFALVARAARPRLAPGEAGVDLTWSMTREAWAGQRAAAPPAPS